MGIEFGLVLCLLVWAVWLLGGRDVCVKGEAVGSVLFFFFNFSKYILGAVCDERLIHSGSMNNLL